jgi:hypothetical protein
MEAMRNSFDRTFSDYFPKHLDDSDIEVKREAIYGVGYLGITAQAEELRTFFEDDEFRSDALFAYALSVRAEVSRGRIKALFRKIEDAAFGLSEEEIEIVQLALDERLMLHGHKPVFHGDPEEGSRSAGPFKKCCGAA